MNRLRLWWETERRKLAPMGGQARVEYIWQYYKVWIITLVSLIAVGCFLISHVTSTLAEDWLYVCFVNPTAPLGQDSELYQDFAAYSGFDLTEKNLGFDDSLYCRPSESMRGTYYQMLVTYLEAGKADAVVMNTEDLQAVGATGRLMDLYDPRMGDLAERYADRLIWCDPYNPEYEGEVAIGIDLSDTKLVTQYGGYEGDAAIGFNALIAHPDAAFLFLEFLLGEDAS